MNRHSRCAEHASYNFPLTDNIELSDSSVSDILLRVKPYLDERLISTDNFADIQKVACYFPGNLTNFMGFECRLGEKHSRVDFLFAISMLGNDRNIFAKLLKDNHLPAHLMELDEWRRISDFAVAWSESDNILYKNVRGFWLEFDMHDGMVELPLPSVFFGPQKPSKRKDIDDFGGYNWIVDSALPQLRGAFFPKIITNLFEKSIQEMPENTTPFQIGFMMGRPLQAVRIHINKIKPEHIIPYLKKIGYKDDIGKLQTVIKDFENMTERLVLSFDITEDGIDSKIGLELSFPEDNFEKENRWGTILEHLEINKLCLPEKRKALLSYPGTDKDRYSGIELKPVLSAADYSGDLEQSCVVRYISHIKLVYQPDKPLEAKAYLAVRLFESVEKS